MGGAYVWPVLSGVPMPPPHPIPRCVNILSLTPAWPHCRRGTLWPPGTPLRTLWASLTWSRTVTLCLHLPRPVPSLFLYPSLPLHRCPQKGIHVCPPLGPHPGFHLSRCPHCPLVPPAPVLSRLRFLPSSALPPVILLHPPPFSTPRGPRDRGPQGRGPATQA